MLSKQCQDLLSQADLGVRLRHPEAAGMALLGAELAVAEYNASPLPASHLACLGGWGRRAVRGLGWRTVDYA
mgnify:CR=1 FL=1